NTAVSTNPVFNFKIKGAKVGDKVVVSWVDNTGEKGSGETTIIPG
ncbi:MAG: thiosulfate oxidation carrier complex protein SoxZ, partial [Rhodocyclaceae bacterium]